MQDFRTRPLSWSSISSFNYNKEQWAQKYIDCIKPVVNAAMKLGKEVGTLLAEDPSFMPLVPRHSMFEFELKGSLNNKDMVGYIDSYEPHTDLLEYKTGKRAWDQKRVDEHGQFDMYLLLLNLAYKVKPEDVRCRLVWLPTRENGDFTISLIEGVQPHIFETKRTTGDIIRFGAYVGVMYKEMLAYAEHRAKQAV